MSDQLDPVEKREEHLWNTRWEIIHRVWLSSLYHSKRERFFDFLDKASKALAVVGGATAVSQLVADPETKLWAAAVVSIVSTLSLVVGFSQKSARHGDLAKEFKRLWAQIEEVGAFPGEKELDKFRAQIIRLETAEPASLSALVKRCENQIAIAAGHPDQVEKLTLLETMLMHIWDFQSSAKR